MLSVRSGAMPGAREQASDGRRAFGDCTVRLERRRPLPRTPGASKHKNSAFD